jgi:hypothetical protein
MLTLSPLDSTHALHVALMAQYLNVHQSKLGTITIQTAHNSMMLRTEGHCPR